MAAPENDEYPQCHTESYATEVYSSSTSLNTIDICLPRPPSTKDRTLLWILYIHGGAWQDPLIDSTSFKATREKLQTSPVADQIAGYASINYRLSAYPAHPTHPSDPSDPSRQAKHPDHINDVLSAILHLQDKYRFDERYVLVGHSCGATLALQVAMKRYWGSQYQSTFAMELNVEPPVAIVGLEGIYDIPALVKNHAEQGAYRDFITNAFGSSGWDAVSPAKGNFEDSWQEGQLVVLGHSEGDSLVEVEQRDLMRDTLLAQDWTSDGDGRVVELCDLKGDHDEVWEAGDAARAVERAVQKLQNM